MAKNLKDYREKELKFYVVGNVLVMMLLTNSLVTFYEDTSAVNAVNSLLGIGKDFFSLATIMSLVYVFVFIFDSLIPGHIKDWICSIPCGELPGKTIFDKIKSGEIKDVRFTQVQAQRKYCQIYEELEKLSGEERKRYSNSAWYKIYQAIENEPKIFTANRDYLLCRDLCIATIGILFIYLALCLMGIVSFACNVGIYCLIEIVVTNVAMRMKQKRLVVNVITVDIHKNNGVFQVALF